MPQLALFPLNTVLFPGGLLPLRIFETRYVDMVGRCTRGEETFGVVLVENGSDTDRQVATAPIGTSARIVDFQTLEDGLLGILCHGERRFRIHARSQLPDGLNCAEVEWLEEAGRVSVPEHLQPLVPLLREALGQLKTIGRFMAPDYEDACWVGYRLAELLPLDQKLLQRLLESDDPIARLELLAPLIDLRAGDVRD
jgi:Lon protease-like protein